MAKTWVLNRCRPVPEGPWDSAKTYLELSVVYDESTGSSYTSRVPVPAGTPLTNTEYWVLTSNFNAQLLTKSNHYANVVEMKADTSLQPGMVVYTNGYYSPNDGGAANYLIVEGTYPESGAYHQIGQTSLYAQYIFYDAINVRQFGAKGDGVQDDTLFIQDALNQDRKIYIPNGNYRITASLTTSPKNTHIYGEDKMGAILTAASSNITVLSGTGDTAPAFGIISNIQIKGSATTADERITMAQTGINFSSWLYTLDHVFFSNLFVGIDAGGSGAYLKTCLFTGNTTGMQVSKRGVVTPLTVAFLTDCTFEDNVTGLTDTINGVTPFVSDFGMKGCIFQGNNQAFVLKGVMQGVMQQCWIESSKINPVLIKLNWVLMQNRYNGATDTITYVEMAPSSLPNYSGGVLDIKNGDLNLKTIKTQCFPNQVSRDEGLMVLAERILNNQHVYKVDTQVSFQRKSGTLNETMMPAFIPYSGTNSTWSRTYHIVIDEAGKAIHDIPTSGSTVTVTNPGVGVYVVTLGELLYNPIINVSARNATKTQYDNTPIIWSMQCSAVNTPDPSADYYNIYGQVDTIMVRTYNAANNNSPIAAKIMISISPVRFYY